MKTKKIKDRRAGALTLSIAPQKREELRYGTAEWLVGHPSTSLADFRYLSDAKETVLYYDVTGLVELKRYVQADIGLPQYVGILTALVEVLDLLMQRNEPTSLLLCGMDHVFVTPEGAPRFVVVPLSGVPAAAEEAPLALLRHLGTRKDVSFALTEDARHADALLDWAKRNPVFSLSSFKRFLEAEFGLSYAGGSGRLAGGSTTGAPSAGAVSAPAVSTGVHGVGTAPGFGVAAPRMAFDPVALMRGAPSAGEVLASQGLADRVRGGVAGISPTAAPQPASAPQSVATPISQPASAPVPQPISDPALAPDPAPQPVPTPQAAPQSSVVSPEVAPKSVAPAPMPVSSQPAEPPVSVKHEVSAPSGGTSLLGVGSISHAAASVAGGFVPLDCWLERLSDGSRYLLEGGSGRVIGRGSQADVKLTGNTNVSRTHLRAKRTATGIEVVDLGSANGTFVQGRRLVRGQVALVRLGESIKIADEEVRFVERQ